MLEWFWTKSKHFRKKALYLNNSLQHPILKELGIKEWELHDPDFRKFYQWLEKNITTDNIFTEEDQQCFDAIPPDERLEGVALQYEMDRIEKKYPRIMDITPELVARKTEEVAQLAVNQAVYQKIADDLRWVRNGGCLWRDFSLVCFVGNTINSLKMI